MSVRVGVLHTVPALVPVFHELLQSRRADLDVVHLADGSLLADAVSSGVTDRLRTSIGAALTGLRDAGAEAVLVTCSSIGEAAEDEAAAAGIPLVRVDAAMAREAVERALAGTRRILVLATLDATLGPTRRLVERAAAGRAVRVDARVVAGAAAARSAGDTATHDRLIGEAVAAAGDADVIVLAQASMAAGAGSDPRALTSPASGAADFVDSLADAG